MYICTGTDTGCKHRILIAIKCQFKNLVFSFLVTNLKSNVLDIQRIISIMLKMLIPVKRPSIPPDKWEKMLRCQSLSKRFLPKADTLSKKLSLLVTTVTDTSLVAIRKITSALNWTSFSQIVSGSSDVFIIKKDYGESFFNLSVWKSELVSISILGAS